MCRKFSHIFVYEFLAWELNECFQDKSFAEIFCINAYFYLKSQTNVYFKYMHRWFIDVVDILLVDFKALPFFRPLWYFICECTSIWGPIVNKVSSCLRRDVGGIESLKIISESSFRSTWWKLAIQAHFRQLLKIKLLLD